jgi:hypothetical protein
MKLILTDKIDRNTYRLEAAFRRLAPLTLTAGGPGHPFAETAGVAARLRDIPYLMGERGISGL